MVKVIVTLKIMPESPDVDLDKIKDDAGNIITEAEGIVNKEHIKEEPVGFGLKAVIMSFAIDESKGSPDPIAEKIAELEDVKSAEVTMVSRALG